MDLSEVLPLLRRQGGVDQRQAVGLLVGQVRGQLRGELVDDVPEPLVAVVRIRRGRVDGGQQRLDDGMFGLLCVG